MAGGPEVLMYRVNRGWLMSYEEWRDDALCSNADPALFELDAPAKGMTVDQEDEAHIRMAKGLSICSQCPVKKSCSSASTPEDRYWSIRGGQPPEGLFPDSTPPAGVKVRGPEGGFGRKRSEYCGRGHKNWKERPNGSRRCIDCDRVNNREREAARRAAS